MARETYFTAEHKHIQADLKPSFKHKQQKLSNYAITINSTVDFIAKNKKVISKLNKFCKFWSIFEYQTQIYNKL